jgi:hypothetical protein
MPPIKVISDFPSVRRSVDCWIRIKIHLHSRKLTFHYYRDFDATSLPELLTRIKIDLRRLFVTVIDHTNGREHQLLFFKERFLSKDHPDRSKMDRFSAKLRKLGLREETIGYGPSKEKWEAWNADPMWSESSRSAISAEFQSARNLTLWPRGLGKTLDLLKSAWRHDLNRDYLHQRETRFFQTLPHPAFLADLQQQFDLVEKLPLVAPVLTASNNSSK